MRPDTVTRPSDIAAAEAFWRLVVLSYQASSLVGHHTNFLYVDRNTVLFADDSSTRQETGRVFKEIRAASMISSDFKSWQVLPGHTTWARADR